MCIIIVKDAGVEMPTDAVLDECERCNHDGFGLMFASPDDKAVHVLKGAMTTAARNELLNHLPKNPKNLQVVMHFRTGTQGSKTPGNCHPYPITTDLPLLKALDATVPRALVHNGVIAACSTRTWSAAPPNDSDLSDTAIFVAKYLAQLPPEWLSNPALYQLLSLNSGLGKMAILAPGHIFSIGDFNENKGLHYSNYQWRTYTAPATHPMTYSSPALALTACDVCGGFTRQPCVTDIDKDLWVVCPDCFFRLNRKNPNKEDFLDKQTTRHNKAKKTAPTLKTGLQRTPDGIRFLLSQNNNLWVSRLQDLVPTADGFECPDCHKRAHILYQGRVFIICKDCFEKYSGLTADKGEVRARMFPVGND